MPRECGQPPFRSPVAELCNAGAPTSAHAIRVANVNDTQTTMSRRRRPGGATARARGKCSRLEHVCGTRGREFPTSGAE